MQFFSQQTLQRGFPKDDLSVSVRCMDQFVNLDTNMVLVLVPGYPLHSALKKGENWNVQIQCVLEYSKQIFSPPKGFFCGGSLLQNHYFLAFEAI